MFRYLQADPEHFDLRDLKCEFDVILLEPPLEEYYRESGISHTERFWTWDDVCMRVHLPHNYACTASDVFPLICLTHFATTDHEIGNRGDLSAPLLCLSVVRLRRRPGPGQNGKRHLSFLSKHILFQVPLKQNVFRTLSSGNKLTLVLFEQAERRHLRSIFSQFCENDFWRKSIMFQRTCLSAFKPEHSAGTFRLINYLI